MNSVSQAYPSSTVSATEIKVENPHIDLYRSSGVCHHPAIWGAGWEYNI